MGQNVQNKMKCSYILTTQQGPSNVDHWASFEQEELIYQLTMPTVSLTEWDALCTCENLVFTVKCNVAHFDHRKSE